MTKPIYTDDYVWRRVECVLTVRWEDTDDPPGWCYEITTDGELEYAGRIEDLDKARSLQQDVSEWTTVRCYRIGDERDPEGDLGPVFAHFEGGAA